MKSLFPNRIKTLSAFAAYPWRKYTIFIVYTKKTKPFFARNRKDISCYHIHNGLTWHVEPQRPQHHKWQKATELIKARPTTQKRKTIYIVYENNFKTLVFDISNSESPILPTTARDNKKAHHIADMWQKHSIFASDIAYPAVRTKEISISDLVSQGDVAIRPSCRHIS